MIADILADLAFWAWASSALWAVRKGGKMYLAAMFNHCPFDWSQDEGPL